jgi:hypothetical protein
MTQRFSPGQETGDQSVCLWGLSTACPIVIDGLVTGLPGHPLAFQPRRARVERVSVLKVGTS